MPQVLFFQDKIVGGSVSDGNGNYFSGFCIELLEELKKSLRFKYNIRDLGPEAKFGSRNPVLFVAFIGLFYALSRS